MKTKKFKKTGLVFVLVALMTLMAIPQVSAYGTERHVIIKILQTYIDNDGKAGSGDQDWRWATTYSENFGPWYVHQRENAGEHHSDWTSPGSYQYFVMFDQYMDHNDRINMIFEDYEGPTLYVLHEVRITINSLSACTYYHSSIFSENGDSYTPNCGFSASVTTDGPGTGNYQYIQIGVFSA